MAAVDLSRATFAAGVYVERFAAQVRDAVGSAISPRSILDIGCGTGELLAALAARFPDARMTGIDLSTANIALAHDVIAERGVSARSELLPADYTCENLPQFDLIVSYSTLHLIEAPTEQLVDKLSREIAEDGSLIVTIPVENAYNHGLMMVRRLARRMRSPAIDKMILAVAHIVGGGGLDREQLAQRVHYMYLIPNFLWGPKMRRLFNARGVVIVGEWPEPHMSIAQPQHVRVHLKRASA